MPEHGWVYVSIEIVIFACVDKFVRDENQSSSGDGSSRAVTAVAYSLQHLETKNVDPSI